MKYTRRSALMAAFIFLSVPSLEAMGLFSCLKNGYSSIKTSLSNASTGTKVLVGLGALATVGAVARYAYTRYWNRPSTVGSQKPANTGAGNLSSSNNAVVNSTNLNPNKPIKMIRVCIKRHNKVT